ncbi:MAG: DUF4423 domain-containing protein [Proteobacteria bacterium]|nr:DUF4423 domain-containing protein [Pseudomonadota bacterium]
MNLFRHTNYREALRDLIANAQAAGRRVTLASVADTMKVQRSYLSAVLAKKADLNSDQLFLATRYFGLEDAEAEYLILLLEIERSSEQTRRRLLEKKRDQIRGRQLDATTVLKRDKFPVESLESRYFNDPYSSLVHLFLTIQSYRNDIPAIAARLGLSEQRIDEILVLLEQMNLIRSLPVGREILRETLHLPDSHPATVSHATAFRNRAIDKCLRKIDRDDLFFTATFSASDRIRQKIRAAFVALIEDCALDIAKSPSEDVFQMNIDLFRF